MGTINIGSYKNLIIRDNGSDERLKKVHTCETCKKGFYSARPTALYCSDKCRQKNYRDGLKGLPTPKKRNEEQKALNEALWLKVQAVKARISENSNAK